MRAQPVYPQYERGDTEFVSISCNLVRQLRRVADEESIASIRIEPFREGPFIGDVLVVPRRIGRIFADQGLGTLVERVGFARAKEAFAAHRHLGILPIRQCLFVDIKEHAHCVGLCRETG